MEPGRIIAGYRLQRVLGRGSRAVVWEAVAEAGETPVALKILENADATTAERLRREFEVQRRIQSDNVVGVYALEAIDGRLALAQELVVGPDLRAWLDGRGTQPGSAAARREALAVFAGILRGLDAAHQAGVVHRDLKPSNILMARGGRAPIPKIADFGVVKVDDGVDLARSGMVLGTFRYMAPEQLRDAASVDARADLFSAGCILYELLTGNRAFDANNRVALLNATRLKQHGPLPSDLEPAVADVLDRLLSPDPAGRPSSALEVLDALGLPRVGDPDVPRPAGLTDLGDRVRSVPPAALLGLAVVALAGVVLLWMTR